LKENGNISKVSALLDNFKDNDKKTKSPVSTTAKETQAIDADKGGDLENDQLMNKWEKIEAYTEDIVEEWVHISKLSLKNFNKNTLLKGDELNDLSINACQVLHK